MNLLTAKQVAENWNITDRQVRILCQSGKIAGAYQIGRAWLIPSDSKKPVDERTTRYNKDNNKLTKSLLERIDSKREQLFGIRSLTAGEVKRLKNEFLVDYTYNSVAIAGNNLSLQEIASLLTNAKNNELTDQNIEVINHRDAYDYVLQLVEDKSPLTEKIIKHIHSLVLSDKPQDKGIYRSVPMKIMRGSQKLPNPDLVPVHMKQLLAKYNEMKDTMHVIERTAIFHLLFEGIHPFIDGNGRTGRLLINLELLQSNFPAISIRYIDRRRYNECFNSYFDTGNEQKMINFIGGYIEEMLDMYLQVFSN